MRILADGEMKPADAALREMVGRPAISVARILREEKNSPRISYYAGDPIRAGFDNGESFVEVERARVSNEADDLYREIMNQANAINTSSKLKDRIALLERSCGLSFERTAHPTFDRNMRLIDSFSRSLWPRQFFDSIQEKEQGASISSKTWSVMMLFAWAKKCTNISSRNFFAR